ncbi:hypothetical protein CASFOL_002505 [Castilleja foliolosa]|uniref:Uncharacterized protein n=1 Tax=Castilleja foliolosa TaxID=1961234 RepID=A0ABD3EI05_9LAMI
MREGVYSKLHQIVVDDVLSKMREGVYGNLYHIGVDDVLSNELTRTLPRFN